jgi:hypothetical protein
MSTAIMPMPGALRWRALHPLIDDDGACSLIYDLERAAVLEVPEELQLHVAPALETGDPDDDLLSWLVEEDLITMDGLADRGPDGQPFAGPGGLWDLGTVLRLEGEVHVRMGTPPEEAVLQALEVAFRQGLGVSPIQLHLDWDGALPEVGLLERLVCQARRLAKEAGQEVSFDLTLDAAEVTPAAALLLASLPVHVRLRCGAFSGGQGCLDREAERALRLLWVENLADRVTLCFTLGGDARLRALWDWARRLGVRHLDAVCQPAAGGELPDAWLRAFRSDLLGVVREIARELEERTPPIDFRPVSRVVRRLLQSEPLPWYERLGGWPVEGPSRPDEGGTCCASCWARYLCRNSAALVSEAAAEERTPGSCAVWSAEAEAALRLYHRLAQADPLQVLRAFGEPSGLSDELPAFPAPAGWGPKTPC